MAVASNHAEGTDNVKEVLVPANLIIDPAPQHLDRPQYLLRLT